MTDIMTKYAITRGTNSGQQWLQLHSEKWANRCGRVVQCTLTRRPASADRTARRQFQATGQPVSQTQASDAMMSRLPRYEAKCVPVFFSSTTTKTKIFVDENKLIFVTKTTTTTKIPQFSSTKRKLKLKFNLLTKTTTKIWLFSSTRRKFQSRILV